MNTTGTGIYIRMKSDMKKEAQEVADKLGFSLSTLIKAYVKQLIKTKHIDFSLEEKPSKFLIDSIKRAERDIKEGNVSPAFKTGKEATAWLEKQGI
ncbi:type II toxin-antitoxin system RelB/DinJ family antitoxin [Patescibacteria group bacterium]|nr:type II toxin-antitoxin system RelB/DinJ family antitoxin [Patescibacteria group bacterium]